MLQGCDPIETLTREGFCVWLVDDMDEYGGNNQIGNEGMKIYMVVMGMKLPLFPTKGQLVKGGKI